MVVAEFGSIVRLRRGDALLKLYAPAGPVDAPPLAPIDDHWYRPGGWRYVALRLGGPDAVAALADAAVAGGGQSVLAPRSHRPGASVAVVADPEGNVWELLADAADTTDTPDGLDGPSV